MWETFCQGSRSCAHRNAPTEHVGVGWLPARAPVPQATPLPIDAAGDAPADAAGGDVRPLRSAVGGPGRCQFW